ncbi:MAG: pyrroline-5-carboxylate reductase family protein, partial [Actinomycetota bacterium]
MASNSTFEVGIIGAGIMGEALIAAILKAGITASSIAIADNRTERLVELQKKYGCAVADVNEITIQAKNILLVVKPQDIDSLLESVGKSITNSQRVISFAAGKKTSSMEDHLVEGVPVLRVMPNTPMSVGVGASAISAGKS